MFSAFEFESFNSKFNSYIKARKWPVQEFMNRYKEAVHVSFFWT